MKQSTKLTYATHSLVDGRMKVRKKSGLQPHSNN